MRLDGQQANHLLPDYIYLFYFRYVPFLAHKPISFAQKLENFPFVLGSSPSKWGQYGLLIP